MMALVKTSELTRGGASPAPGAAAGPAAGRATAPAGSGGRRALDRGPGPRIQGAGGIGAASDQLAAGVNEASAAAEELRQALGQIGAAAEQAAAATQQNQAAIDGLGTAFGEARSRAEASRRMTEALQVLLAEVNAAL